MITKNNDKRKKIIKVENWEEAQGIVFQKIQEGENFRDIAKIKFRINDNIRGINISQISEIYKKLRIDAYSDNNQTNNPNQPEVLKSIFKKLKKRTPIEDLLIEYGDPKLVNYAVEEFKKVAGYEQVPKRIMDGIRSELSLTKEDSTYDEILFEVSEAVYAKNERKGQKWQCDECEKFFLVGEDEMKLLHLQLRKHEWCCNECLKKYGLPKIIPN